MRDLSVRVFSTPARKKTHMWSIAGTHVHTCYDSPLRKLAFSSLVLSPSLAHTHTQRKCVHSVCGDNSFAGATAELSQKSVWLKNPLNHTFSFTHTHMRTYFITGIKKIVKLGPHITYINTHGHSHTFVAWTINMPSDIRPVKLMGPSVKRSPNFPPIIL